MAREEPDGLKTKKCPRCGAIAVCTALNFVDDPVLMKQGGLVGSIGGGIFGKAIGELITWHCKSCHHKFQEPVYIGGSPFSH